VGGLAGAQRHKERTTVLIVIGAVLIGVIVGLMGSGGSVMTVPLLVYVVHQNAPFDATKVAVAESMAIVGWIAIVSVVPYIRSSQVAWDHAWLLGLPGIVGAVFGSWLGLHFMSGATKLILLALIMLTTALRMICKPRLPKGPAIAPGSAHTNASGPPSPSDRRPGWWSGWVRRYHKLAEREPMLVVGFQGLAIGIIAGVVGVGGGFLIVPTLVLICGLGMRRAIGTSLIVIAMQSIVGFAGYQWQLSWHEEKIHWQIVVVFGLLGSLGGLIGHRIGQRIDQQILRKWFAILLLVLGTLIVVREATKLAGLAAVRTKSAPAAAADPRDDFARRLARGTVRSGAPAWTVSGNSQGNLP
jgi:uncharacterized membrane protein YfcA